MKHDEKQAHLVASLLARAERGELDWKKTAEESVFQVSFTKNSVQISHSKNQGLEAYRIQLLNQDGDVADEFDFTGFDQIGPRSQTYNNIKQLYELARRRALGADAVLDEILKDLETGSGG